MVGNHNRDIRISPDRLPCQISNAERVRRQRKSTRKEPAAAKRPPRPWTEETDRFLIAYYNQAHKPEEIAASLGRPTRGIERRIEILRARGENLRS